MSTSMMYPTSVTCEIIPEYEDEMVEGFAYDYSDADFNLIDAEDDDPMFVRSYEDFNY